MQKSGGITLADGEELCDRTQHTSTACADTRWDG